MADEKVTVIDAQADFEGKLKGKDAVIQGRFRGEIALTGRLVIAEGAKVEAAVSADAVEAAGELKGDVQARSFTLADKARIQGTIDAKVLVVREGAWLNGSVSAGEQAGKAGSGTLPMVSKPVAPAAPPAPPAPQDKGDKAGM